MRVIGETRGSDFAQAAAVRKAPAPDAPTTNLVAERKANSPRPARVDAAVEHPRELFLRDGFVLLDEKLFNGWSNRQKAVFTDGHYKGPNAKRDLAQNGRVFRDRGLTIPGEAPNGCYWIKPDEQSAMRARDSQFPATFKPEQLRKFILSGCMNSAQHFDADVKQHVAENGDTKLRYVFKVTQDLPNVNLMDRASSTITMKCVVDITDMDKKVIISAHPVDF
jgi:hypothetical protein